MNALRFFSVREMLNLLDNSSNLIFKCVLILWLLIIRLDLYSQVVNVEQARVNVDTNLWESRLDISYFSQKFDDDLTTFTGRFSSQMNNPKYFVLFLADAGYSGSNTIVITDYKLLHFRSSYKIFNKVRWEGFIQAQDNVPLGIQFRGILGTGPRFSLLSEENWRIFGGIISMLEYELTTAGVKDQWVLRSSNYMNLNWRSDNKFGLSSTVYYQPRFSKFTDYRISGQHSLVYSFTNRLNGKLELTHFFDSHPPSEGLYQSRITTFGLNFILN